MAEAFTAVHDMPASPYAAAVHEILRRLQASHSEAGAQTILVTARDSGTGVSALAANIAFAAAENGEQVLLIEANGTRPSLSALTPRGQAATQITLKGATRNGYRLAAGGDGSLMVVPLERPEQRGGAARAASADKVNGIRNNFSLVVVDAALLGDPDAAMMASAATDVLVVTTQDQGEEESVAAICEDLNIPKHKLFGLVLSALNPAGGGQAGRTA